MNPSTERQFLSMEDGLVEMLEKTDEAGTIGCQVHSRWVPTHPKVAPGAPGAIGIILREFYDQPFLIAGLESLKTLSSSIDATYSLTSNGNYEVQFNLLKMLCVNADLPGARIQTIDYFRATADFFDSQKGNNADVQYINIRDNTAVHGAITCRAWSPDNEKMVADESWTLRLNGLIKASPALQHHVLGMAKIINKMGPHSYINLRERQIFGPNKGPRYQRVHEGIREAHKERAAA